MFKKLNSKKKQEFLSSIEFSLNCKKAFKADKIYQFKVKWIDSAGVKHINKGYRVQWNNLNGPYKGGMRFHPSVTLDLFKSLAFEQTLKNILTTLPMGGAKGGSDFDPHDKSDDDIKLFCQAFIKKIYKYIGEDIDIPAGDIGVGSKEIVYMFDEYIKLTGKRDCAFTGKPIDLGGCLGRKEATGYGLCYITNKMLNDVLNTSFKDKKVIISGSGNVAIYAAEKAIQLGGKVIAMSDSNNAVYDSNGVDLKIIKEIKEQNKGRIKGYLSFKPKAKLLDSKEIWNIKADIVLPCATQNEIDVNAANKIIASKSLCVCEGSNMSTTYDAVKLLQENGILYLPGKASNAGGVTVSGFEIEQSKLNKRYSFDEVDNKLKQIMENIFSNIYITCGKIGKPNDFYFGTNYYAFKKLKDLYDKK